MNKQIKVLIKKYSCKSFILQHFSSMLGCSLKLNASPSRPSHTFALAFAQYNGTVSHLARAQRSCLRTSHTSALEPFAELSFAHWLSGVQSHYVSLRSWGTDCGLFAEAQRFTVTPFAHLCPRFAQRVQSHYVSLRSGLHPVIDLNFLISFYTNRAFFTI